MCTGGICIDGLIQTGICESGYYWKDPEGCQPCLICNQYIARCGPFTDSKCAIDKTNNDAIIASVVCLGCLFAAGTALWYLNKKKTGASRRLLKGERDIGITANQEDLPWELRHKYEAVKCIGFGRSGVILEATDKLKGCGAFAIKLVFPKEEFFSAEDLTNLEREV